MTNIHNRISNTYESNIRRCVYYVEQYMRRYIQHIRYVASLCICNVIHTTARLLDIAQCNSYDAINVSRACVAVYLHGIVRQLQ